MRQSFELECKCILGMTPTFPPENQIPFFHKWTERTWVPQADRWSLGAAVLTGIACNRSYAKGLPIDRPRDLAE